MINKVKGWPEEFFSEIRTRCFVVIIWARIFGPEGFQSSV